MSAEQSQVWAVPVPIGYRIGDWEVVAPIATGNYASVYAARPADGREEGIGAHGDDGDEAADSTVALKFLATSGSPRQSRLTRELADREVTFSLQVAHDRLITVTSVLVVDDSEVDFDGAVVLVMARAAASLDDRLRASPDQPLPEAARLIVEICEGLHYLHGSGWVHGDLKPSNILIMADGSVRLADFGLVTRLEGTHGYGAPLGSTDYLPPDRLQERIGEQGVVIRPSTDIWALGVTAHQILTGGSLPIAGSTPGARASTAQEIVAGRAALRLHHDIDDSWREFIALCLLGESVDITVLLDWARSLADPRDNAARHRVRRRVLGLAAAITLGAIGGAGYWWWHAASAKPATHSPAAIRVYNVELACQQEHSYSCSLGLALNPYQEYAAGNVSSTRAWHNDILVTDCVIYDGVRVADETGAGSVRWFRVMVPGGYAWLPGVRTLDDPQALPICAKS